MNTISAARPRSLKDEIIELAKLGNAPKEIAKKFEKSCHYNYVANVVAEARRNGEPIPKFRTGSRPANESDRAIAPAKPTAQPPSLDYFELRALKKMLGDDLKEIEADADLEGLSIASYVREVLLDHARKIRE